MNVRTLDLGLLENNCRPVVDDNCTCIVIVTATIKSVCNHINKTKHLVFFFHTLPVYALQEKRFNCLPSLWGCYRNNNNVTRNEVMNDNNFALSS